MKSHVHRSGYTLLEIVIVVAIILLFSAMMLPRFNDYTEQSKLKTNAQKLADVFALAQKKASAKETISSCTENFSGYQIQLSESQYVLNYCCAGSCSFSTLYTYLFDSPVTIHAGAGASTNVPYPYPIQFTTSSLGTSLTSAIDIYLRNTNISGTNKCIHLNATTNGIVTVDSTFSSC